MVFLLDPEDTKLPYAVRHFSKCKHFTQIDPDPRKNPPERIEQLLDIIFDCKPATDAIIVAGTQNVLAEDLVNCVKRAMDSDSVVYAAPSSPKQVNAELLELVMSESIPLLIYHAENAQNTKYMAKPHAEFEAMLHEKGINLDKQRIDLGYIVLNRKCAVGSLLQVDLKNKRIAGYALAAARKYPVVYLEGSGTFVGEDTLQRISYAFARQNIDCHIIVGGGIADREIAATALKYADSIVVGKVLEDGNFDGYKGTAEAARQF